MLYVEFYQAHANDGLNLTEMLFAIQLFESFLGHGSCILCGVKMPYCNEVLITRSGLGKNLMFYSIDLNVHLLPQLKTTHADWRNKVK